MKRTLSSKSDGSFKEPKLKKAISVKDKHNLECGFDECLEEILTCAVCCCLIHQASSCTPCMHTFCGACISDWHHISFECPSCREHIHQVNRDHKIDSMVEAFALKYPSKLRSKEEIEGILEKITIEYGTIFQKPDDGNEAVAGGLLQHGGPHHPHNDDSEDDDDDDDGDDEDNDEFNHHDDEDDENFDDEDEDDEDDGHVPHHFGAFHGGHPIGGAPFVIPFAAPQGFGMPMVPPPVLPEVAAVDVDTFVGVTGSTEQEARQLIRGAMLRGLQPPLEHAISYFYARQQQG